MLSKAWSALARIPWWVWAIALVALVPRLLMVPYGLPYELDPDERLFVDAAWNMVESGIGDPGWYAVPASTLMDIAAVLYWIYAAGGVFLGEFDSIAAAGDAHLSDVSHFFAMARVVVVISGVGLVLMTYALARALDIQRFWGAVAASLVAISFPMIQFSALIRPDMLMTMFLLAAVIVSMRALDHPSLRVFAVAGIFLGLAAASKYPGAMAIVPIVAANATLVVQERIAPRRGLLWLGAAIAAAAAVALLVAPFLYLNPDETIKAVAGEARGAQLAAGGGGAPSDLARYLTEALPWAIGGLATAIGVVGLVAMLASTKARLPALTFWVYAVFISVLALWWLRWVLPLVPFVAVGGAYLLAGVETRLLTKRGGAWIWAPRVVIAAIILLPVLASSSPLVVSHAANDDTRMLANEWIEENVPRGSTILVDSYTTQVGTDEYDIRVIAQGHLVPWAETSDKVRPDGYFATIAGEWWGTPGELIEEIEASDVDYIAVSDLWFDSFRAESETYPTQLASYELIDSSYPVVARFDGSDAPLGWALTIYEVPEA